MVRSVDFLAGPLRLVAIGPESESTRWCAEQALLGTGTWLVDVLAADDGRRRVEQSWRLMELAPDAVLVISGAEGGDNSWLLSVLELLPPLQARHGTAVYYAGNSRARALVSGLLGPGSELVILPNLQPEPGNYQLMPVREAIAGLAEQRRAWGNLKPTDSPGQPTGELLSLRQLFPQPVDTPLLLVDVGSAITRIFSDRGGRQVRTVSPYGLGHGIFATAERINLARLELWLGRSLSLAEWLDFCGNRMLMPTEQPVGDDSSLLQAVARELLRSALVEHLELHPEQLAGPEPTVQRWWEKLGPTMPPAVMPTRLAATGELFARLMNTPEQAAGLLLDGLQPEGVTELYGQRSAIDCLRPVSEQANSRSIAAQPFANLELVGTAVCPFNLPAQGRPSLTVLFKKDSAPGLSLRSGELTTVGRVRGKVVEVDLLPEREVDLGAGPGRPITRLLSGGALGLIIDCRGRRPLPFPVSAVHRRLPTKLLRGPRKGTS